MPCRASSRTTPRHRTTSRTSSTPPARRAAQRGSRSSIGGAVNLVDWAKETFSRKSARRSFSRRPSASTFLSTSSSCRSRSGENRRRGERARTGGAPCGRRGHARQHLPSVLREVLRGGPLPKSVRCVNLAGEALYRELVDQVYAQSDAARVMNLYGPSETTTYSTFEELKKGGSEFGHYWTAGRKHDDVRPRFRAVSSCCRAPSVSSGSAAWVSRVSTSTSGRPRPRAS